MNHLPKAKFLSNFKLTMVLANKMEVTADAVQAHLGEYWI